LWIAIVIVRVWLYSLSMIRLPRILSNLILLKLRRPLHVVDVIASWYNSFLRDILLVLILLHRLSVLILYLMVVVVAIVIVFDGFLLVEGRDGLFHLGRVVLSVKVLFGLMSS